jgi:mono/diheme cytochrome c family protein
MKFGALLSILLAGLVASPAGRAETQSAATIRPILNQYCVTCHNQKLKTGGLTLENLNLENAAADGEVWEKVIRKLRAGTMPPPGLPRPDRATYASTVSWLSGQLDQAAKANPYAGRPALHRLNRAEYGNAIRDLLALDIDASTLLPPDDSAYGFDNISDALGVSPALQERYLAAAIKIAAVATGDPDISPTSQTWLIRQDLTQNQHLEQMPLGTVGGTLAHYNFPLSAEYRLQAKLYRTNLNIVRGLETAHQVEFSVDGKRVLLATIGGPADLASLFDQPTETGDTVDARLRVETPVSAGPHTVTVAFVQNSQALGPDRLQPFIRSSVDNFDWAGSPHLQSLTISGPFNATGSGDTPSRRKLFSCRPAKSSDKDQCAREIVSSLLLHAYRRPVENADLERAMKFYRAGVEKHGFEGGIQAALERILASPKFLYRIEVDPADAAPGSLHPLSGYEVASRLSFFLWSSIPDDELLTAAGKPDFNSSENLRQEIRRMLADPKSEAFVSNFAGQWLQLRNLRNVQPNTDEFPDFDDNLRRSFRTETELLFESVLKENRSVLDLMTADYTFVNERLARHYGIPDIYGTRFRRVPVPSEERRGLLGQGSVLALTSHAERTSPVVRGKWILENLMGAPVPPPPPDVPPLKERKDGEKPRTMREQMTEHRANPVCASCHKVMDPIGFSLENFDAVGAWRTNDSGNAIDASGELADGSKINGVIELRNALLARPEVFTGTVSEKLLTYGLGRGLDYRDMPTVRRIVQDAAANNYRLTDLIAGVVESTPFRMRTSPGVASSRETETALLTK